jgi:hypothetical protein
MPRTPTLQHALGAALLAAAVPLGAGVPVDCRAPAGKPDRGARAPADQPFVDAVTLFRQQRLSAAYGRFLALAQDGDADAARIAQFMHRYGPVLFATHWDASADELEDWASLARTAKGRPAPRYVPGCYRTY